MCEEREEVHRTAERILANEARRMGACGTTCKTVKL